MHERDAKFYNVADAYYGREHLLNSLKMGLKRMLRNYLQNFSPTFYSNFHLIIGQEQMNIFVSAHLQNTF